MDRENWKDWERKEAVVVPVVAAGQQSDARTLLSSCAALRACSCVQHLRVLCCAVCPCCGVMPTRSTAACLQCFRRLLGSWPGRSRLAGRG